MANNLNEFKCDLSECLLVVNFESKNANPKLMFELSYEVGSHGSTST